ncbi:MAG: hypothetical protein MHPSP_002333, partial [Paramarteilia canceri]
ENEEYSILYEGKSLNGKIGSNTSISEIVISKTHQQFIRFITPEKVKSISHPELVCIDEAAAIPLPIVRKLLKNKHVIMASTVSGYEGTGRSLSLKLITSIKQDIDANKYPTSNFLNHILAKIIQ